MTQTNQVFGGRLRRAVVEFIGNEQWNGAQQN